MLSNLKFDLKTKIIGIASSFSLPLLVLGYFVISNINYDINFSTLEQKGNEYQRPLAAILQGVVDHQVAVLARSQGGNVDSDLTKSVEAVNNGLEKLKDSDLALGADLQFTDEGLKNKGRVNKNQASLKSAWAKILKDVEKLPASEPIPISVMSAYEGLVADVRTMITHLGDTSNLILDPDLDSYYMMDVTLLALPQTQDRLGKIAVLVNELSKKPELSQEDRISLRVYASFLKDDDVNRVTASLATSLVEDANFYGINPTLKLIKPTENKYVAANMALVDWLNKSAVGKTPNWSEFAPIYQNARSLSFELWHEAISQLDVFLASRLAYYKNQRLFALIGSAIALLFACYLSYLVLRSITKPVSHLVNVMKQIAEGESNVRANIDTTDEVGTMARQFDAMVDQREALNAQVKEENERLNDSVINILQSVAQLSQRNLTIKVPVSEDITGPVGDSLNQLTEETARVLNQVKLIAEDVANASRQIKTQSDNVINVAAEERRQVVQSAAELNTASEVMQDIAKLATSCNEAASQAITNTEKAQETVLGTVQGITAIRDTIRETEKRIKRLGERSQEIGGVVTIINGIAERTHTLALNASMHAASAGEAGRGFAVVASEVQKLAENARDATSQISALVNNIQVETNDTVTTMNDAITQVVQGTTLAQQAGNQMKETRDTTANLVQLVQRIAENSKAQSETTQRLRDTALNIQKSSEQTYEELQNQGKQTERLVDFSGKLVESVGVFTLPAM